MMYNTSDRVPESQRRKISKSRVAANLGIAAGGLGIGYAGLKAGKLAHKAIPAVEGWGLSAPAVAAAGPGKGLAKWLLRKIYMQSKLREIRFDRGLDPGEMSGKYFKKYAPFSRFVTDEDYARLAEAATARTRQARLKSGYTKKGKIVPYSSRRPGSYEYEKASELFSNPRWIEAKLQTYPEHQKYLEERKAIRTRRDLLIAKAESENRSPAHIKALKRHFNKEEGFQLRLMKRKIQAQNPPLVVQGERQRTRRAMAGLFADISARDIAVSPEGHSVPYPTVDVQKHQLPAGWEKAKRTKEGWTPPPGWKKSTGYTLKSTGARQIIQSLRKHLGREQAGIETPYTVPPSRTPGEVKGTIRVKRGFPISKEDYAGLIESAHAKLQERLDPQIQRRAMIAGRIETSLMNRVKTTIPELRKVAGQRALSADELSTLARKTVHPLLHGDITPEQKDVLKTYSNRLGFKRPDDVLKAVQKYKDYSDWQSSRTLREMRHRILNEPGFWERPKIQAPVVQPFSFKNAPHLKKLGAGLGIAAGIAGAGYLTKKILERRREQKFDSRFGFLKRIKISPRLRKELIYGGALAGGISIADAVTSAAYPDPEKTRAQSALAGAKRGLLYGTALAGSEPFLRKGLGTIRRFSALDDALTRAYVHADTALFRTILKAKRLGIKVSRKYPVVGSALKGAAYGMMSPVPGSVEVGAATGAGLHFVRQLKPVREAGVRRVMRRVENRRAIRMRSKLREIRFDTKPRRQTVAMDRYRKMIKERETARHESNVLRTALAGAALGGVFKGKASLAKAAGIGGAIGAATQAGIVVANRKRKDIWGDPSLTTKRVERLPYQLAGLTSGALLAHKLYRKFGAKGRVIQFQDNGQPPLTVVKRKGRRKQTFLEHTYTNPEWGVSESYKRGSRLKRLIGDIYQKARTGQVVDERGREKVPEWEKPWAVKTAAVAALSTSIAIPRVRGGIKHYGGKAIRAVGGKLAKIPGATPTWNLVKKAGPPIQRATAGPVGFVKGAWGEAKSMAETINKGVPESAIPKTEKQILEAAKKEEAARAKKLRDLRAILEGRSPGEEFKSKTKAIEFAEVVPDWDIRDPRGKSVRVYAPGSTKRTRRSKSWHERKANRDLIAAALIGTGTVGGTGLGAWGLKYLYDRKFGTLKGKDVPKNPARVWGIFGKQPEVPTPGSPKVTKMYDILDKIKGKIPKKKNLSARLDDLIQFQELSKAEIKRRKNELGHARSRTLDAIAGGAVGAGIGGTLGAGSAHINVPSLKDFNPFKRFRPGFNGGDFDDLGYGATLSKPPSEFPGIDISGEHWKFMQENPAEAFQQGKFGQAERAARKGLTGEFRHTKRLIKRGSIGAAAGLAVGAAPFLLKKPYPKGAGKETEGKKIGGKLGSSVGALGGLVGGAFALKHGVTHNPLLGIYGGLAAGAITGNLLGGRVGSAIGSRQRRTRGRHIASVTALSARLDDLIEFRSSKKKTKNQLAFEKHPSISDGLIEFRLFQPSKETEPTPEQLPFKEGDILDYLEQAHHAKRAGPHTDLRIGGQSGMYSWATKKPLPEEGQKIRLHPQPIHPHHYNVFQGEIPSGYGAGTVATQHLGKALVTRHDPEQTNLTILTKRGPHRLALLNTKLGKLLVREKHPEIEAHKPKMKTVQPEGAESYLKNLPEGTVVQPKVDGALVYVSTKGGEPEVHSYRTSKHTGKQILHTERFFRGRPRLDIPKEHQRSFMGELYGEREGRAIPPQELGGILNAHIGKSIERQQSQGVQLKVMPFDLADRSGSYPERLAKLQETVAHLPQDKFQLPETATDKKSALELFRNIRAGRHPQTQEGVVAHPPSGQPVRIKNYKEDDVKITGTFPGRGKFEGIPGGFTYKTESGQEGRVGTGFSDQTRAELEQYIGRRARIKHQGKFPGGKYRAPSLIAVHESKN